MTTAGTERIPRLLARWATFGTFMSSTLTSHDGQATRLTMTCFNAVADVDWAESRVPDLMSWVVVVAAVL